MTVVELIEELRKYPSDMHIVVDYDGGWALTPPEVSVQKVHFDGEQYTATQWQKRDKNEGDLLEVVTIW